MNNVVILKEYVVRYRPPRSSLTRDEAREYYAQWQKVPYGFVLIDRDIHHDPELQPMLRVLDSIDWERSLHDVKTSLWEDGCNQSQIDRLVTMHVEVNKCRFLINRRLYVDPKTVRDDVMFFGGD